MSVGNSHVPVKGRLFCEVFSKGLCAEFLAHVKTRKVRVGIVEHWFHCLLSFAQKYPDSGLRITPTRVDTAEPYKRGTARPVQTAFNQALDSWFASKSINPKDRFRVAIEDDGEIATSLYVYSQDDIEPPFIASRALVCDIRSSSALAEDDGHLLFDILSQLEGLGARVRGYDWNGRSAYFPLSDKNDFRTRVQIRQTIDFALACLQKSREESSPHQLTIAIDIVDFPAIEKENLFPREIERSARLARFEFERAQSADKSPCPRPPECLLITQPVQALVRHWYHCEPIGQIASDPTAACGSSPARKKRSLGVSRVWCRIDRWAELEIPIVDQALRNSTAQNIRFRVTRDEAAGIVALRSVRILETEKPLVLYLRCDCYRKTDLAAPFSECLRDISGVNRRAPGFESLQEFTAWAESENIDSDRAKLAAPLLLGGLNDAEFDRAVDHIVALLTTLDRNEGRLCIVIGDYQYADELTRQVIERQLAAVNSRIRVVLVDGGGDVSPPNVSDIVLNPQGIPADAEATALDERLDGFDDSTKKLVGAAAVIGPELLLSWLRLIWRHLDPKQHDVTFQPALENLLRLGVLRFAGCLCDISDRSIQYRDLRFASTKVFQRIAESEVTKSLQAQVRAAFIEELKHRVVRRQIENVRNKVRVCRIVESFSDLEVDSDVATVMARLCLLTASRAAYAGAAVETERRYVQARRWLGLIPNPDLELIQAVRRAVKPPRAIVSLPVTAADVYIPPTPAAIAMAEEFAKQRRIPTGDAKSTTEIVKCSARAWSWYQGFGRLPDADQCVRWLYDQLDKFSAPSFVGPRLEILHDCAVTTFYLGEFDRCIVAAAQGRELCKTIGTIRKSFDESRGDTHDGGICCKLFLIMSQLVKGDDEHVDAMLADALEYAEAIGDEDSTKIIALTHAAMLEMLRLDFDKALKFFPTGCDVGKASPHWMEFRDIVRRSSVIGRSWLFAESTTASLDRRVARDWAEELRCKRQERGRLEWESIAGCYEALAWEMAGDQNEADRCFETALKIAEVRSEFFYVPEIYRFRSDALRRRGDWKEAGEARRRGYEAAHRMGATLFEQRLQASR